jgi:hypothetical protein
MSTAELVGLCTKKVARAGIRTLSGSDRVAAELRALLVMVVIPGFFLTTRTQSLPLPVLI